jgi:transcriptional regulator with XRE-family HTH domain
MPSAAPPPQGSCAERLKAIGEGIRARRRQLGITAVATAGAAGISRVTLHRIESGAASVTVGALINVLDALDLRLGQLEEVEPGGGQPAPGSLPGEIELAAYPELRKLAWQLKDNAWLRPVEAAGFYARNRRHLNLDVVGERERQLMETLGLAFGRVDGLKGRDASRSNACWGS